MTTALLEPPVMSYTARTVFWLTLTVVSSYVAYIALLALAWSRRLQYIKSRYERAYKRGLVVRYTWQHRLNDFIVRVTIFRARIIWLVDPSRD